MKSMINRRDFLKQSALAAAFAAFSPAISPLHARTEGRVELARTTVAKKVIVIGAGLAGLSAAYELIQAGHEVTILEARTRPGGRVYTLREPFSDGLYAEAGAARIPDCHELTLSYVKHFGLTLDPFEPSEQDTLLVLRGKRIKIKAGAETQLSQLPLALSAAERKLDLSGLWQRYTEAAVKAMGNPASPNWPPAALQQYDRMNFAAFLRQQGASASAIELLEMPYYKPADDSLSALWWLREAALLAEEKHIYKIRGGSDLLPKAFAAQLAEKIRYDAPVTRIHHDERGVSVVYGRANGAQQLTADYLVCAIPFSVLRRMEITPPFSPEKQKAIAEQSYDSATRVFLQVRRRYWEREGLNGFATTDLPDEIWHPTFDQPGSRGLLVSYTSGAQARRVAALIAPERVDWLNKRVERIYPGLRENFERGASFCWDEDEWARGAYSILKPGQMFSLLPQIARPEGRVHFAGEHTSAWPAWQQGALASGNRVAREINQAP